MSQGLIKLMKKHPRLFAQYRTFVVGVMVEKEFAAKSAKSAKV
jgi:hypothetical protein